MKDKPMPDATTPNPLPCPFCGSIDKAIAAWNQSSAWQPIETAPRGGKGSIGVPTEILVWNGYEMRVELPQVGYRPRDTHWHPLPSPPISP